MPKKKKMGRPTDSVKAYEIKTKVNEDDYRIMMEYCKKVNKNRSEVIREMVHNLKDKLEK